MLVDLAEAVSLGNQGFWKKLNVQWSTNLLHFELMVYVLLYTIYSLPFLHNVIWTFIRVIDAP